MNNSTSVDLSASRQSSLYSADIITFVLAITAVGLRIWSRQVKCAGIWFDDWFICIALVRSDSVGAVAMLANFLWCKFILIIPERIFPIKCLTLIGIPRGYGKHSAAFGPHGEYYFFLGFFVAELIYTFIIVFVKYSILALYWRLFRSGSPSIKLPILMLTAVVTSWGIAVLFLSIFTCVPPKGFWDKSIHAACNVNSQQFLFGISIPNILTDVALLVLPIPYVLQLKSGWPQKRLLLGTFLLGGFVCLASVMRLVSVSEESTDPDFSWNWVNQGIWAVVESNFAIISACLPTLRPVWMRITKRHKAELSLPSRGTPHLWTIGSKPISKRGRGTSTQIKDLSNEDSLSTHPFATLNDNEQDSISFTTKRASHSD
ncbi:Satratoxin biosynthesis SC1 cluster protein, partial [Lachnellula willkommii]